MDRRGAGGCGAAPVGTEAGGSPDSDGGPGAGPTVVPLPGAAELIKGCWRRSRVWVRRAGGRPCPPPTGRAMGQSGPPPPGGLWDSPPPPPPAGAMGQPDFPTPPRAALWCGSPISGAGQREDLCRSAHWLGLCPAECGGAGWSAVPPITHQGRGCAPSSGVAARGEAVVGPRARQSPPGGRGSASGWRRWPPILAGVGLGPFVSVVGREARADGARLAGAGRRRRRRLAGGGEAVSDWAAAAASGGGSFGPGVMAAAEAAAREAAAGRAAGMAATAAATGQRLLLRAAGAGAGAAEPARGRGRL